MPLCLKKHTEKGRCLKAASLYSERSVGFKPGVRPCQCEKPLANMFVNISYSLLASIFTLLTHYYCFTWWVNWSQSCQGVRTVAIKSKMHAAPSLLQKSVRRFSIFFFFKSASVRKKLLFVYCKKVI